jgi:hypothetical protein
VRVTSSRADITHPCKARSWWRTAQEERSALNSIVPLCVQSYEYMFVVVIQLHVQA